MRLSILAAATVLLTVSGSAATVQAARYAPPATSVQQGHDGGSATGGPVGGLPDRN